MKSNGSLVDLIEKVKPEIRTLIEKCNTVSKISSTKGRTPASVVYLSNVTLLSVTLHEVLQVEMCKISVRLMKIY